MLAYWCSEIFFPSGRKIIWIAAPSPYSVSFEKGAERVFGDHSSLREKFNALEEVITLNEKRKASEEKRYNAYYDISAYDLNNFDIIIDTTKLTVDEVFKKTV